MDDPVQPDAGQGEDATGGSPFDSYLESVPDEHREPVSQYLKDAERNVNSRLQEAAEYRKQWEPLEGIDGLRDTDPQQLQELLAWHQAMTQSPDAFGEWLREMATEAGLVQGDVPQEEPELDPMEAAKQLLATELGPIQEQLSEFQREQQTQQLASHIRGELDGFEIPGKPGSEERQQAEELILKLGLDHEGEDWVKQGYEQYRRLAASFEKQFVGDKLGQPLTPETGAGGSEKPKPITDWKEAAAAARERFAQSQAT